MKRIRKRLTALLLSCFLAFSGIAGSYQTAQAAEIVAGYTIGQILESILLSFGISIFTTEMIQKGTSATWWDTDGSAALKPYYDDLEQAYEEQRFKVINGGGGQNPEPSPTPAPGTTPIPFPTTVPVPGDIPTFKELVAPALAGTAAFINMTQGAWECMGKAVSSLWDKMLDNTPPTTKLNGNPLAVNSKDLVGKVTVNYSQTSSTGCNEFFIYNTHTTIPSYAGFEVYLKTVSGNVQEMDLYSCAITNGKLDSSGGKDFNVAYYERYSDSYGQNGDYFQSSTWNISVDASSYSNIKSTAYSYQFYVPYLVNGVLHNADAKPVTKEEIWVHPDLQDTYKNNGKLEYPQQVPRPLQIPSGDQLADLSKKLNPEINTEFSPEMAPNYIQELIQQLQKGLNPDPDPNPDPNPNPNPNPDPDPDPDPNPTGSPDPEPTKVPDEDSSSDVDPKDYAIDLRKIFPFCIPFDLMHLLNVLDAEPEAPRFEIPVDLEADNPFTGKKIVNYHTKIVIDMSDYEQPIKVIRIFEIIFFILALLLITRDQMIKG